MWSDPDVVTVPAPQPRMVRREDPPQPAPASTAPAPAPKPLPATILVYRDGHRSEVRDYAIAGDTLYDLGNGLMKKIKLSDLDLDATTKVNDERGVAFNLPRRG